MKYTYEQIEALLLTKDYEALTASEKLAVGLSAGAYTHQRRVLLSSQQILSKNPASPKPILSMLQEQLQQKYPTWWQRGIPLYQVALLFLLVGGIAVCWPKPVATPIVKEKLVYINQVDTVIQERVRIEEKLVYKTQKIVVVQRDTIYLLPPTTPKEQQQFYQEKEENIIFAKQPKSKSMKEMNGLMDFVVGEE